MRDVSATLMAPVNMPTPDSRSLAESRQSMYKAPISFNKILERVTEEGALPEISEMPEDSESPMQPGLLQEELTGTIVKFQILKQMVERQSDWDLDEQELPPELVALLTDLPVTYVTPIEPLAEVDMEVISAVPSAELPVLDELKDLLAQLFGQKDDGVFLRTLEAISPQPISELLEGLEKSQWPQALLSVVENALAAEEKTGIPAQAVNAPDAAPVDPAAPAEKAPLAELVPLLRVTLMALVRANGQSEGREQGELLTEPEAATPEAGELSIEQEFSVKPEQNTKELSTASDDAPELPPINANHAAAGPVGQSADGQGSAPGAPVERVPVSSLVDRITQAAAQNSNEGVTRLELQLNPEFLGKVSVVLTSTSEGMTASLKSGDNAVRNLLAANITTLQDTLRDMGITMKNVEVTGQEQSFDFSQQSRGQNQFQQQSHGDRAREAAIGRIFRMTPAAADAKLYTLAAAASPYEEQVAFDSRA